MAKTWTQSRVCGVGSGEVYFQNGDLDGLGAVGHYSVWLETTGWAAFHG